MNRHTLKTLKWTTITVLVFTTIVLLMAFVALMGRGATA